MKSRRQFIKQTLVSTATLALATACRRFGVATKVDIDPATIKKFGANLKGRLILPTDPAYDTARRVKSWNPLTEKRPVIIAQCAHADDVARAVEFARRHGLATSVRAGGHSFLGWGTCDSLLIDLSAMNRVGVDPSKNVGKAEGGVLSGEFLSAAGRHGLAPVLGECTTVGIAGLTLGGGLGWLSGKYGAVCDNLLSARLITADGRSLVADATHNPDLFWAIRGGGGNFGIAISFEYRLQPVREVIAGAFFYDAQAARAVLHSYRDYLAAAPDELQTSAILANNSPALTLTVCYAGDLDEGERVIRPLRKMATPLADTVKRRAFTEMTDEIYTMPLSGEAGASAPFEFEAIKGVYLERLPHEVIDIASDRLAQAPAWAAIGIDHYMHGAVCRVPAHATAFELRKPGAFHAWIGPMWRLPAAAIPSMAWAEETWRLLRPYSGDRIYANFQSVEVTGASQAVFGGNHSRLAAIKKKYDPTNFFRRNPNINPASA